MSENTPHITPKLRDSGSIDGEYFDRLYAAKPDPWEFASSPYEAEKYAATLAALPLPRYQRALELGCSIGVLTQQLARRCHHLLAVDVSPAALAMARDRCDGLPQVEFEHCDLAASFPEGCFELILVSEVAYYFSRSDFEKLCRSIEIALAPGGHLLLVHYTGETNYPLTGDAVHELFRAELGSDWTLLTSKRGDQYRLDLLCAPGVHHSTSSPA